MEGRVSWTGDGGAEQALDHIGRCESVGATHVSINTMGAGFDSVDQHLDALGRIAEATESR